MGLYFSDKEKEGRLKKASKYLTIILLSLGTVTLFFSQETSIIVYTFSFISLITSIIVSNKSELDSERKDELIEIISQSLSKSGKRSPLIERVQKHINKKGYISKDILLDIEKAYYLNKNDLEAAKLFLSIKTMMYVHHKIYHKSVHKENRYLLNLEKELAATIKKKPNVSDFYVYLGIVLDYKREFKRARQHYNTAGKLGSYEYSLVLLSTSFVMSGEFMESLAVSRLALKKEQYSWNTYFNLGRIHFILGNLVASAKYLELARNIGGNKLEIVIKLFESYLYQAKHAKAFKLIALAMLDSILNMAPLMFLKIVISLIPFMFITVWFNVGKMLFLIGRKIPFIRLIPNPVFRLDIYEHTKVSEMIQAGLIRSAVKTYKKAIAKAPFKMDNYNNLAACYLCLHEVDKAKQALSTWLKLKYRNQKILNQKLQQIDSLLFDVKLDIRNYKLDFKQLNDQIKKNEPNSKVRLVKAN